MHVSIEDRIAVAKIAGYVWEITGSHIAIGEDDDVEWFEPWLDGDQAIRLAGDLELNTIHHDNSCEVYARCISCVEPYGNDRHAAVRLAIWRAAVEKARRAQA